MPITLKRAQLKKGVQGLDITVKLSKGHARNFAPTWDMVMGVKNSTMTEEEYTALYLARLNGLDESAWDWLREQAVDDELTLLCFCRSEWFCHTHLLIDYIIEKYPEDFIDGRDIRHN